MTDRIWEYLTTKPGAKLPGHAKEQLIAARDEIERLRAALSMTREGVPADEAMRAQHCAK